MWQALVVTGDRDLLVLLREQLEAPGYAVVEAGSVSDAVTLLETSGACFVLLLEHLLGIPRGRGTVPTPPLKNDPLGNPPAYLLLAANPMYPVASHEPLPPPPVLLVFEPEHLEDLLGLMAHADQYLGRNPTLLAASLHPSRGNLFGESW